jgi:anthranilate/para-aminobenzoate synthase component I
MIKRYLEKGDSYQINLTQPKEYQISGNPFDLYMSMREYIQPHCGMYLQPRDIQILSFSPERFFKSANYTIESFPMKGTRPRSDDIIQDESLAEELYHSEKDRAEHLMIVDLIRNDIGKVSKYGSVEVDNLYGIESFETVHQMVSWVHGKLKIGIRESDIVQALFPGGSITGAPKERSMKIIDSLENYQRGVYTGALGAVFANGNMDFNIAIRTMTIKGDKATYPVGGGIVWDSDPLEEWQEAQQKSRIIDMYQNNISEANHSLKPVQISK